MTDPQALVDQIFAVALDDGPVGAERRDRNTALWIAGVTLLADVLLRTDQLNRERLLRGLERELREALVVIPALMRGPSDAA